MFDNSNDWLGFLNIHAPFLCLKQLFSIVVSPLAFFVPEDTNMIFIIKYLLILSPDLILGFGDINFDKEERNTDLF